jgi:hypothetical protein
MAASKEELIPWSVYRSNGGEVKIRGIMTGRYPIHISARLQFFWGFYSVSPGHSHN